MKARHMQTRKKERKREGNAPGGVACCFEWMEAVVGILLLVTVFFTFLCGLKRVDNDSMEPALYPEDLVLTTDFFYQPQSQDMVLISGVNEEKMRIERVVALEGQTVDISVNGEMYVDGEVVGKTNQKQIQDTDPVILHSFRVPEGFVFVTEDHKELFQEQDWEQNVVDKRRIKGKVEAVVFPFDRIQKIG